MAEAYKLLSDIQDEGCAYELTLTGNAYPSFGFRIPSLSYWVNNLTQSPRTITINAGGIWFSNPELNIAPPSGEKAKICTGIKYDVRANARANFQLRASLVVDAYLNGTNGFDVYLEDLNNQAAWGATTVEQFLVLDNDSGRFWVAGNEEGCIEVWPGVYRARVTSSATITYQDSRHEFGTDDGLEDTKIYELRPGQIAYIDGGELTREILTASHILKRNQDGSEFSLLNRAALCTNGDPSDLSCDNPVCQAEGYCDGISYDDRSITNVYGAERLMDEVARFAGDDLADYVDEVQYVPTGESSFRIVNSRRILTISGEANYYSYGRQIMLGAHELEHAQTMARSAASQT